MINLKVSSTEKVSSSETLILPEINRVLFAAVMHIAEGLSQRVLTLNVQNSRKH
jgi:hypothetical protein